LLDDPLQPDFGDALAAHLGADADANRAYTLSKAGLNRMCRRKAVDWGRRGLRIVSLSPGLIATPQGAESYKHSSGKVALFEAVPAGRECSMLEIAGVVAFLTSDQASYITGTDILNEVEKNGLVRRETSFMPGPIFKNLVLADEINRTPPKTQAALLQAMQERRVTVGTTTHALPDPFQVFATRNPIEQEGTYPLPEAQLDRFLLEVHVEYPSEQEELEIARRTTSGVEPALQSVVDLEQVRAFGALVPRIPITDEAVRFAVACSRASRPGNASSPAEVNQYVRFGAGPRGSQALVLAAKARAALRGEAAADVDDVRELALPALRHRLVLGYRADVDGVRDRDVVAAIVKSAKG
jgi:MoxR-like ATPase